MSIGDELLNIKKITKSYGGVTVLKDMDFVLRSGEVHCIVGENGAGKSTFIKALSGAIIPDYGEMTVYGKTYKRFTPNEPIELGIATVYQDVDLVETLTVADNIFLGDELKRSGMVDVAKQRHLAQELLESLGIKMPTDILVEALSPAQKQNLQIVRALRHNSRVIIMDEPTASLGEEESAALIRIIRQLTAQGIGIVYISHYIDEVLEIADTVTILKDGEVTASYKRDECTHELIIEKMVGRAASLFYQRERIDIDPNDIVLELDGVTNEPLVKNVSFNLRRGEILGIGGLVGSGRSELARIIFGKDRKQSGSIIKEGRKVNFRSPKKAIKAGICMLGEDRKRDGLFMVRSLMENVRLVNNEDKLTVSPAKDRISANKMIDRLRIRTTGPDQEVQFLSGGNQQKCLISRWILSGCDIFIFDEPTKGVDIGAREDIYELMIGLAKEGKAVIMISSDMPEILSMSDRVCVMRGGTVTHILESVAEFSEEELLKYYMGIA